MLPVTFKMPHCDVQQGGLINTLPGARGKIGVKNNPRVRAYQTLCLPEGLKPPSFFPTRRAGTRVKNIHAGDPNVQGKLIGQETAD